MLNSEGSDVSRLYDLSERYLAALLRRDSSAATSAIDEASRQGWSTTQIYLEVLAPAQVRIGQMWHAGRANVAEEHLATQITLEQMERLRQRFSPSTKWGMKATVACVEGNLHALGARIVADLLILDGWDVEFLGASTPTHDLVEFVRRGHPGLVGLSVSSREHLGQASRAVAEMHGLPDPPKLLVGGYLASQDYDAVQALEADGVSVDAAAAVREARSLMGLSREPVSLNDYLILLGQRVQELRRGHRWSQEQLAQSAGLDRTYISAVEHGKQNLTIGAVVKLADALEVPLGQLLTEDSEGR